MSLSCFHILEIKVISINYIIFVTVQRNLEQNIFSLVNFFPAWIFFFFQNSLIILEIQKTLKSFIDDGFLFITVHVIKQIILICKFRLLTSGFFFLYLSYSYTYYSQFYIFLNKSFSSFFNLKIIKLFLNAVRSLILFEIFF